MSYENVPKNLPETTILTRAGLPEYTKLDAAAFPVPSLAPEEIGAVLLVTDTGDRFSWTGSVWVQIASLGKQTIAHDTNFKLELSAGRIKGKSFLRLFGRSPDITSTSGFEALWEQGGAYTGFDAVAAEPLSIVSTSALDSSTGTGARQLLLSGLDINFNPISETVTLNGINPVITTNSYYRWIASSIVSVGSTGFNQGLIVGKQSVTVTNIMFDMPVLANKALNAVTTVPAGKVFRTSKLFATFGGKTSANSEIKLLARTPPYPFQVFEWFSIQASGTSYIARDYEYPLLGVPAGTDLLILADSSVANSIAISGGAEFIVEDVI